MHNYACYRPQPLVLPPMITKDYVKFQPDQTSYFREKVEQTNRQANRQQNVACYN